MSTAPSPLQIDPRDIVRLGMQSQQGSTAGMTQIAPQAQPRKQSSGGFKAQGLPAVIMAITSKVQQRKKRELDQMVSGAVSAFGVLEDAPGLLDQGNQMLQDATEKLKQNPQDPEALKAFKMGQQIKQNAEQSMKQAQTNLDDMFDGPKGEKHAKVLGKAMEGFYAADPKSANSPERQALVAAIQKQQGVSKRVADFISRLPQRPQLSPESQQRQQVQQAGIIGKPATEGQKIAGQNNAVKNVINAERDVAKVGLDTDKMIEKLPSLGLKEIRDKDGNVERNPDHTLKVRNLTLDELKDNQVLAEKYQAEQSKVNFQTAQAKATGVRAMVSVMKENRIKQEHAQAMQPENIAAWEKQLTDPKTGVTLAQVPSAARGLIVSDLARRGQQLAKPLGADELKRADLAHNAVLNIQEAQDILKKRPDMFGPGGWGKTKFEYALAGGDPDALKFQAAITLANLPAVGIHGVRGKWAIEDLQKLDGNLYLNGDSMGGVLGEILRLASEFQESGGRQPNNPGAPPAGATIHDFSKE